MMYYVVMGVKIDGTTTDISRHFKLERAVSQRSILEKAYNKRGFQISVKIFQDNNGKFFEIDLERVG